jgi:hypothetical protein
MDWMMILAAILFGGVQIWTTSQIWSLWKVSAMIYDQQKTQLDIVKLHQTVLKTLASELTKPQE